MAVKRRKPRRKSAATKDSRLKRAKVSGYNKPKRTPGHKKKSHIVVAKVGTKVKTIVSVSREQVLLVSLNRESLQL